MQAGDRVKIMHKTKNAVIYGGIATITDDGYMMIANNGLLQTVNSLDKIELFVIVDGDNEVLIDFDNTKSIVKYDSTDNTLNDYDVIFSTNARLTLDKDKKLTINFMMDF